MLPPALLVLAGLLLMTALVAIVSYVVGGGESATAALMGCAVFAVPTMYFTLYAFRFNAGKYPAAAARAFYWGQASKLSLMAMGFALVFKFTNANIPAVFVGFCLMIPAHVAVAMFVSNRHH